MADTIHNVAVLGAGRVGAAIARDLARDGAFRVTAVDVSDAPLERLSGTPGIQTLRADLRDASDVERIAAAHDLVVGAVPGPIGFATVRSAIAAARPIVDISFFEEDALELDAAAREAGIPVVVDCGVAPGLSNLLLGHASATWDSIERFACYVGGLPVVREWPFEYRAPFSPIDVVAEYTRPARFRRGGRAILLPALSEVELIDFPGVGTLEAFNTDGLRTLLRIVDVPDMVEKTMRYPGHAERMRMLRDSGFFDEVPLDLPDGTRVRPLDVTARLLDRAWRLAEGDEDLTVFRVEIDGARDGRPAHRVVDLLDRYDAATRTTSMARTTGYTCTAVVRLIADGLWDTPGIAAPELIGRSTACNDFILEHLRARGVDVRMRDEDG